MNNLAIIPARSGSKGVINKNIRDLCGKPLMAYSIEAALQSEQFDEVMVSTDSNYYADIAIQYGASVPFLRSKQTASDTASSWDMVEEVLNQYKKKGESFNTFCLLQPTSPLRTSEDIKESYKLYNEQASFAVVSVCEMEHSPLWCGILPDNHELIDFIKEDHIRRRQDTEKYYRINGAIYIVNTTMFMKDKFLYKRGSFAYIMDPMRSIDIDTDFDFILASLMLKEKDLVK